MLTFTYVLVSALVTCQWCTFSFADFIVLFKAYHNEEFRQSAIVSALGDFISYFSFVCRNYSFMEHLLTSDFEVIEVGGISFSVICFHFFRCAT